jgi:hypothetical protein
MANRSHSLVLASLLAVAVATPLPALAGAADLAPLLSNQIARCWNPPPKSSGAVTVRFDLREDGSVVGTPKVTGLASAGVADSAVHAVKFCAPYHLPRERYTDWQHAVVKLSTGP